MYLTTIFMRLSCSWQNRRFDAGRRNGELVVFLILTIRPIPATRFPHNLTCPIMASWIIIKCRSVWTNGCKGDGIQNWLIFFCSRSDNIYRRLGSANAEVTRIKILPQFKPVDFTLVNRGLQLNFLNPKRNEECFSFKIMLNFLFVFL